MGVLITVRGVGIERAEDDPGAPATELLDRAIRTAFPDTPPARRRSATLPGHPAQMLLDVSAEEGTLMLIVGSRGHGAFVGLLIGSTSAYCAEHATCPVLIVRDKPTNDSP